MKNAKSLNKIILNTNKILINNMNKKYIKKQKIKENAK